MSVATDPDQKERNVGQRHSDEEFARLDRQMSGQSPEDDAAGEANERAQHEYKAQSALSNAEAGASEDDSSSDKSVAEREAAPEIPFKPDSDDGSEGGKKKKKGVSPLRMWMLVGSLVTMIGGGGAFYSAITGLPRDLIEQATRETRQRISNMYQESIKPYMARYLAKYVFGNAVGINDCAGETGNIVTKDCFYRHKKDDYPKTMVGRAWQAWKDGRIESRIFKNIDLSYNSNAILDPATGRRGPLWIITTPAGTYPVDPANPDGPTQQLFETREFTGSTRTEIGAIHTHLMESIDREAHVGFVGRAQQRDYMWRKLALRGCNHYCEGKQRIEAGKSTLANFKSYTLGLIALKTTPKSTGLFLACMLSKKDYSCLDSDSRFQEKFASEIDTYKAKIGESSKLENLLKLADEAKREKSLAGFILKKVIAKLAERISPALGSAVTNAFPIVGQIITAITTAWSVFSTGVLIYAVFDFLSGPQAQLAATYVKAEGFAGAWSVLGLAGDERNGVKQVYDPDADAAYADVLKGYEKSLVWQSQYGNVEGLKDYQALFSTTAYAATTSPDEYPNTCSDDGIKRPPGALVCPNWLFDYKPPIIAAAQAAAIPPGSGKDFADEIAQAGDEMSAVIGAPFDAAAEAALETQVGKDVMDAARSALDPLLQPAIKQVLSPPFQGSEDMRGAKLLDGAWAGSDWIENDMVRGGLEPDGTPHGWGRVLTDEQVQQQATEVRQQIDDEFSRLPIWDRIFSTKYTQSFASRFAFSAPTAINSPFQFAASILSPITSMRFAALSQTASAAITPASNFFHIPNYGATIDEIDELPMRDENDATPCPNDRTPPVVGTPGTIDRGLGRAEYSQYNPCLLVQAALKRYSAYDNGEPLDPTTVSGLAVAAPGAGTGTGAPTGTMAWPIAESDYAGISSCYAATAGRTSPHAGSDFLGIAGDGKTKILAVDGGEVVVANPNSTTAGGYVVIKHSAGLYSMYMHMYPDITVKLGDKVEKGAVLGREGHFGQVTGPHLHFAINSTAVHNYSTSMDPLKYLPLTGAYKTKSAKCL